MQFRSRGEFVTGSAELRSKMPFQFTLATVLKVRESLKKQEERALQCIVLEIAQTSHEMERAEQALADARHLWQQALRGVTAAADLHSMIEEEQTLASLKHSLVEKLNRLDSTRNEQVKRYQAAHRQYEALLNMKRQRQAEYDLQQTRAQQKFLDDIFIARRLRK